MEAVEKKEEEEVGVFKMEIKTLSSKGEVLKFSIKGAEPGYINALRRYAMTEVPVMAIEDVEFRKNDSILYDEIIALRLGLIPLKTDLKSYDLPPEEGPRSAKNELKMTLKAKGPGIVYASDMKSKDPKIKSVYPKIPIVKLSEGQNLEFEATAILGRGSDHSKFNSCLAYYQKRANIKIKKQPENKKEVAELCPKKVFDVKGGKLSVKNQDACILCNQCTDVANSEIEITTDDAYIFTIESWGQLSTKDIFKQALVEVNAQLDAFDKVLDKA